MNIKKNKLFILVVLIIFVLLVAGCSKLNRNTIIITNNSKYSLTNMNLKYTCLNDIIEVGTLNSKETYTYKIKEIVEDSITIEFTDSNGNQYSEVIVGYTTPSMNPISVSIEDNTDSTLSININ